ncbi:MAG: glycosyltransferase, partial [Actinomycetota bacterium]
VVTIQDLIPLDFPASMPNRLRRSAFRRIIDSSIEAADAIIVPSDVTGRSVVSHGGDPAKITKVALWPSKIFRPSTEDEIEGARVRFAGGRPYIASLYHRKPHKNMKVIPAVAQKLSEQGALLLCSGHPSDALHGGLPNRPLSEDELRSFIAGSEAFLLPSSIEGFGLPVLEAFACGVPVVCGPRVGAAEGIDEALIVDVDDPLAIAEGLMKVAGTKPSRVLTTASQAATRTLGVYLGVVGVASSTDLL